MSDGYNVEDYPIAILISAFIGGMAIYISTLALAFPHLFVYPTPPIFLGILFDVGLIFMLIAFVAAHEATKIIKKHGKKRWDK